MITVNDKIRTFSKYVHEKEVKASNERIVEAAQDNEKVLESKKKEIEKKRINLQEKSNKKIKIDTQNILSTAKLEAKNNILNLKRDLLEKFMSEIINSLIQFVKGEDYLPYLNELLDKSKNFLLNSDIRLYLVEKDLEKYSSIIKEQYPHIEILKMDDENIGGMIIEAASTSERIDLTIKRKVNEWKNEIGLRLYEALEKQVKDIE